MSSLPCPPSPVYRAPMPCAQAAEAVSSPIAPRYLTQERPQDGRPCAHGGQQLVPLGKAAAAFVPSETRRRPLIACSTRPLNALACAPPLPYHRCASTRLLIDTVCDMSSACCNAARRQQAYRDQRGPLVWLYRAIGCYILGQPCLSQRTALSALQCAA